MAPHKTTWERVLSSLGLSKHTHAVEGFGSHSIGWLGSVCLVANNIIGPGMMTLPGLFQTAGWLPSLLTFALVSSWTGMASLFLARAMAAFRGNGAFSQRVEFGKIAFHLFPRWAYYAAVGTVVFVFFCNNLANIVLSAQVMDETLVAIAGRTCALVFYDPAGQHGGSPFVCVDASGASAVTDSVFGSAYVLSIGYLITAALCLPLGLWLNLEDNIIFQILGMLFTLACVLVWLAQFLALGLQPALMPAVGADPGISDYGSLFPTVLFNYGFVATIPSWLNEKEANVRTVPVVWISMLVASAQFLILGIFGGLAIDFTGGTDVIAVLDAAGTPGIWAASRFMTYVFPVANIMTSIPIFSIIIRYNLLQLHGVRVPVWAANGVATVAPWAIALFFFAGDSLSVLIAWASALLFVQMNLLFPIAMYVVSERAALRGVELLLEADEDYEGEGDWDLPIEGGGAIEVPAGAPVDAVLTDAADARARHALAAAAAAAEKSGAKAAAPSPAGAGAAGGAKSPPRLARAGTARGAGAPSPRSSRALLAPGVQSSSAAGAQSFRVGRLQRGASSRRDAGEWTVGAGGGSPSSTPLLSDAGESGGGGGGGASATDADGEAAVPDEDIHAVPRPLRACLRELYWAYVLFVVSVLLGVLALAMQIYTVADPSAGGGGGSRRLGAAAASLGLGLGARR